MTANRSTDETACSVVHAKRAETLDDIDAAFKLESQVFLACGYGEMPRELDAQSTFYIAVAEADGQVVGVMRMIEGTPLPLPALGLPIDDAWKAKLDASDPRLLAEYGALAVPAHAQARYGQSVAKALYRAGWRHTIHADVTYSCMVMEPRRARVMARWHGLEFEQAGPSQFYMGGDVAAHFARPVDLLARLGAANPQLHDFMLQDFEIDLTDDAEYLRASQEVESAAAAGSVRR